jgi:hypothetical protein
VTVSYARDAVAADAYAHVTEAIARESTLVGSLLLDPERQVVGTPRGGTITIVWVSALFPGEVLLRREGGQPLTLAVATRDAEPSHMVAAVAETARQALAGKTVPVLPAFM